VPADLDESSDFTFTDQELIEHLRSAVNQFGVSLSTTRYNQMYASTAGRPRSIVLVNRFGGWDQAIELLQITDEIEAPTEKEWTDTEILNALKMWIRERGGRYGLTRKVYRFDSSRNVQLPPLDLILQRISPDWSDVIELVFRWQDPHARFVGDDTGRKASLPIKKRKAAETAATVDQAASRLEKLLGTDFDL
jgi:hypothetical protein